MRNGWNWKYPLSNMYPAYTQLVAEWSSPSIGDQRATGWSLLFFDVIRLICFDFKPLSLFGPDLHMSYSRASGNNTTQPIWLIHRLWFLPVWDFKKQPHQRHVPQRRLVLCSMLPSITTLSTPTIYLCGIAVQPGTSVVNHKKKRK